MFHKAIDVEFLKGTALAVKFQTGEVKKYDISDLFPKYPQLQALRDRKLFRSGKLVGAYGIVWTDELDIETETIYEDGETIRVDEVPAGLLAADVVLSARADSGLTQIELANLTGIDQADISKIERGIGNPSLATLNRIAKALGRNLKISFE